MRCQRCNAVMVHERYYGPGDPFWGWRCMLCGNISDPMILENRSQCAALSSKGEKKGGQDEGYFRRRGKAQVPINGAYL